jgi:hypothetical protein
MMMNGVLNNSSNKSSSSMQIYFREAALISATSKTHHSTMTHEEHKLDAHAKPPDELKAIYKRYQKVKAKDLEDDEQLLDLTRVDRSRGSRLSKEIDYRHEITLRDVASGGLSNDPILQFLQNCEDVVRVYEHTDMPGTDDVCPYNDIWH